MRCIDARSASILASRFLFLASVLSTELARVAETVAKHQLVRAVVVAHQLVQVEVEGVAHAELADAHRRVGKKHKALAAARGE